MYVFTTRQVLRLLCLRGEILDSRLGQGRYRDDLDVTGALVSDG
jgi:hypothetical protein